MLLPCTLFDLCRSLSRWCWPLHAAAYEILELYLELLAVRSSLVANSKEIPRDMIEVRRSCSRLHSVLVA
jgi:hypothetical protein